MYTGHEFAVGKFLAGSGKLLAVLNLFLLLLTDFAVGFRRATLVY